MADYDYWLSGNSSDARIQCVEISHPAWSKAYRIVQNYSRGIELKHENGFSFFYEYVPLTIRKSNSTDDLDQELTIGVGDLGEWFPKELDAVLASVHRNIRPILNYREYNLSDLTKPQITILGLEVTDYEPVNEGAVFICRAKRMNLTKTGVPYDLDNFVLLRSFV